MDLQTAVNKFKFDLENAIKNRIVNGKTTNNKGKEYLNGQKAKEALIRSQIPIKYIHEAAKKEFINHGVNPKKIFPPLGKSKPEIKITGWFKKKDQDILIQPTNVLKKETLVDWGPLAYENYYCKFGEELLSRSLSINVRSQVSSIAKNTDTLFERTYAEALNLHLKYPKMCLGEIYLIPVKEYDGALMEENKVGFIDRKINLEKYISFFTFINKRPDVESDFHLYEECALIIVDFARDIPKIYNTTQELIDDGHLDKDYPYEIGDINFYKFAEKLINTYKERFKNEDILK